MSEGPVTLFLAGDVMLGRGVDQILAHPGDPGLREDYVRDARDYVALAEAAAGPVPRPVDPVWPWGEALPVLDRAAPDVRVVNLETAVTGDGDFAPGKAVHYRMHPANLPCLAAARPDVCALANNHVLDFGPLALEETLDSLAGAGLRTAGAGRTEAAAWRPATVPLRSGGRVLVLSFGMPSSGIPETWAATAERPGVALVDAPTAEAAAALGGLLRSARRPGDIAVASVHWGSNWGYGVSRAQVRFAHALVDAGVDIVHGHSSHHPRPLEVYRERLVLYGCGDLVDDYEGIGGHERYRDDLRLLYLVSVEPGTGRLTGLRMVPLRARRMRLEHASAEDTAWLRTALDRCGRDLGTRVEQSADGTLTARPLRPGAPR
ncbi:putative polyglutamine synthesis accessory protein [Streptomyces lucensis JCM 4490]|uniref:Polyglutamine synthesis accessory protein n=1 Tax=Streptomyces lucensis JCM 4490 TaxID=1306176 RepID=A0A918MRD2_9ACTN|nr:CapA family protein [Streptomyces lucensis]GGW49377.1 putative polyglutamine synthesis accessory protein [Streptomyces lucensis JCM 4490]